MYGPAVLSVLLTAVVVSASNRGDQKKRFSTDGAKPIQYDDLPAEMLVDVGEVGGGNYTYYTIRGTGHVTILLDSLEGDADLYVSSRRKEPTFSLINHEFHSTTCGLDRVDVGHTVSRPLYIGVYGHPSHELTHYRIVVLAIQLPKDESVEYAEAPDVPDEFITEIRLLEDDVEGLNTFGEVLLKILRFLIEIAIEVLL